MARAECPDRNAAQPKMKSRVTILILATAILLLLVTAGVLSLLLLDLGIRDKGGKLPDELPRKAAARSDFTPALHEIIEVGDEVKKVPGSAAGITREGVTHAAGKEEVLLGAHFGAPLLSVGCPHCVTYGSPVTDRHRFPAPAIHDIALLSDGAVFTLFPGRLTEKDRKAAAARQKAADAAGKGAAEQ